MKKNYLFGMLALAAMTMVGCSNDEVVNDYSQDNAIQFGTYVGRDASGRGTVIDTNGAEGNVALSEFGVFAFYRDNKAEAGAEPNFMNNQKVEKDENSPLGNGWTYSPVKYWPNEKEDLIDFYAYAPYEEQGKTWDGQNVIVNINSEVSDQKDYLWATPVLNQGKQAVDDEVVFTFHHALTRVGFKVEAVIDEVNDQEDGVNPDTDNQGKDYYDGATTVSVQEVELYGPFFSSAKLNLNDGTLSDKTGDTQSYKLGYDDFVKTVADNVTTTKQQLNIPSEYMMFIPSEYQDIKVRVKYTVTTKDDKLTNKEIAVVNDITSKVFDFTFEQGKAYNFVLHLGLTSVKLSATVSDWTDGGDVVVNVPINFEKSTTTPGENGGFSGGPAN